MHHADLASIIIRLIFFYLHDQFYNSASGHQQTAVDENISRDDIHLTVTIYQKSPEEGLELWTFRLNC